MWVDEAPAAPATQTAGKHGMSFRGRRGHDTPYAGGAVSDRRRYPRVQADVLCRPAGAALFHHKRNPRDISLGGMRVFSDEEFTVGSRVGLDVLLQDGVPLTCWAEVVWILELDAGATARFDVGLKFTDMAPADIQRLAAVMVPVR